MFKSERRAAEIFGSVSGSRGSHKVPTSVAELSLRELFLVRIEFAAVSLMTEDRLAGDQINS